MKKLNSVTAMAAGLLALGACGGNSSHNTGVNNPCNGANPCDAEPSAGFVDWSGWASWTKVNKAAFVSQGHRKPWVNVYVPQGGVAAYTALAGNMPVGFAVVKSVHDDVDGGVGDVAMLTVMQKMAPGYDPENGDWYYGIWSADGTKPMKEGTIEMCINCHSGGEDYLFGIK